MLQRFAAAIQFLKLFEMLMSVLAIRPRLPTLRGYFKVRVSLTIFVGLFYRCMYVCQQFSSSMNTTPTSRTGMTQGTEQENES